METRFGGIVPVGGPKLQNHSKLNHSKYFYAI